MSNHGAIPIQRGIGVDKDDVANISPWMSTLQVVLFRVDTGNQCQVGDWFTISLNTYKLEHITTEQLGCGSNSITVTDERLGRLVTMTNAKGRRVVTHVK